MDRRSARAPAAPPQAADVAAAPTGPPRPRWLTPRTDRSGLIGAPSARASRAYRVAPRDRRDTIGRGLFGFRTEVDGRQHLPRDAAGRAGRWLDRGRLPHRTWVDPFVVADWPAGRAAARVLRRRPGDLPVGAGGAGSSRRVGGVIPIWPGGGRAGDRGPPGGGRGRPRRRRGPVPVPRDAGRRRRPGPRARSGSGVAYFALRTGAPDRADRARRHPRAVPRPAVPARGPRAGDWPDLAGIAPESSRPRRGRQPSGGVAHRIAAALHELTAPRSRAPTRDRAAARHPQALALADDRLALTRPAGRRAGRPHRILGRDAVRRVRSSTWSATRRSSGSRRRDRATSARPIASRSSSPSSRCSTRAARSRTASACR